MSVDPRTALLACAAAPDGDVAEAALWLAAEDNPGLDPAPWLERLDELGEELRARAGAGGDSPPFTAVPVIAALLRDRLRLRGAGGGDPQAHYLHTVMERGAGIPIACGALWMAVGRRAGIPVEGIGLPGHFVVRVGTTLVDAFSGGEPLDQEAARQLVSGAVGTEVSELDPSWLQPSTVRAILVRMSRNLRGCHAAREDWARALLAADRCVALRPDAPGELRDRGLLRWRVGQAQGALADLLAYLDGAADAGDAGEVRDVVGRLRAFLN
ncbi:MAG TPA: transglutaminase-like domain-containing protein [Candidatus Angelobacter sp.]|jgi:regulator of sirC expression with transglutaminase-like and TPR domain|nr:transglutaminase-like domain-containing protein [Candidatus Angelobacter sp.]